MIIAEQLLSELLNLEEELKPKIKRLSELKEWCKERGSFATASYICVVKEREQVRLVSLETAVRRLGRETLEMFSMIQIIKFKVVNVSIIVEELEKSEDSIV